MARITVEDCLKKVPNQFELIILATKRAKELLVSALAQSDALAKLLIEKGVITQAEFMQKLSAERAGYQEMLQKVR